jgi:sensory rhodopsin
MSDISVVNFVGALVMGSATAVFLRAAATDPDRRTDDLILAGITGFAFLAYVLMGLGYGRVVVGGGEANLVRYADWLLTTPLIVWYLARLAGVSKAAVARLVVLDVAMIGLGVVAVFTGGAVRWAAFLLSCVAFVGLAYVLTRGMADAAADRPLPVVTLFGKLRTLTVLLWTLYPVVWVLSPLGFGVLLAGDAASTYLYMDVVAKAVFGYVALRSGRALDAMSDDRDGSFDAERVAPEPVAAD